MAETHEQRRERLARVMCELAGHDPDWLEPGNCPTGVDAEALTIPDGRNAGGDFCHFLWRQFVKGADAIIASDEAAGLVCVPREATDEMIKAGANAFAGLEYPCKDDNPWFQMELRLGLYAPDCAVSYAAMIDAAQGKPVGSE